MIVKNDSCSLFGGYERLAAFAIVERDTCSFLGRNHVLLRGDNGLFCSWLQSHLPTLCRSQKSLARLQSARDDLRENWRPPRSQFWCVGPIVTVPIVFLLSYFFLHCILSFAM